MQIVLVAHPGLGLAADAALGALAPARGHEAGPGRQMLAQVLRHEAALGQDEGRAAGAGAGDADDGRLAERVHALEGGGRQQRLAVAAEALHLVGGAELLEEPEDALRARLVEPAGVGVSCRHGAVVASGHGRTSRG